MKRTDTEWIKTIEAARWLRVPAGVFEKLTEQVLVRRLVSVAKSKIVEDIYVKDPAHRSALGVERLEEVIIEASQEFYDNASNGNMTRGGMKNAQLAYAAPNPFRTVTKIWNRLLWKWSRLEEHLPSSSQDS